MLRTAKLVFLLALVAFPVLMKAQGNLSSMTGVVTDQSGAILPNVSVVLTDTKTTTSYTAKTDREGVYRINNVAPGPGYKATFTLSGFSSFDATDLYLQVATTRTQNVTLQIGSASDQIEVSGGSSNVTLNTVDATIGNNFDVKMVNDLPVQARINPQILFNLQPGVTAGAVTGARADQNTVTLDGLDINDIAAGQDLTDGAGTSNFPIVGGAPVDAVQEFRGTVGGQRINGGPGGGGQFQMVTKSGTNQFHGNINEYHRDTTTTANDWFLNNAGVARPALIQNQFGGNIGGPIVKDKLFFFFNFYDQRIAKSTGVQRIVPLDSYRNGNVSYIKAGCPASSRRDTNGDCIGTLTSSQVKDMDPAGIGVSPVIQQVFNDRYPRANDLSGGDGINTGLFRFTTPTPDNTVNYVGRIDYSLTDHQSVWGRFIINRRNNTYSSPQFAGDPLTHPFIDRSYAYVIGHTWQIGANKVNSFQYGDNIQKSNFPTTFNPSGINEYIFGAQSTSSLLDRAYTDQSSQNRRVPNPQFSDMFNWTIGKHQLIFGGSFKFPKTNSLLVGDFNTVKLGLGGNVSQLSSSLRPTDISSSSTALTTYDSAFALALGRVGEIDSNYNYNVDGSVRQQGIGAVRAYRFYQTEAYIGDNWRITPNLTLDYGLRYQFYSVPYETHGFQSVQNVGFDDYFGARMAQSAAGASGDNAVPLISYQLGGKANHGPDMYAPNYKDFAPRFGFTYSPSWDNKTVFNGGAGIIFDRTVINAVNFVQDQSSYLFQNSASTLYGNGGVVNALRTDPRLGANLSVPAPPPAPAITKPLAPFVDGTTPYGLGASQFNTAVDPHLKDPYSITYSFGMQHEFPENFILKMNYVGRLGRRLLAQADASQLLDFPDKQSGQMMSAAFANMTQQIRAGADATTITPQPWFENQATPGIGADYGYPSNTAMLADFLGSYAQLGDFADFIQLLSAPGVFQEAPLLNTNVGMAAQFAENTFFTNKGSSNYNGVLVTLTKNTSHGLQFDVNYTWSHSIDNVSVVANTIASSNGSGFICDARNNRICRGNSDFDIAHSINANFLYDLPFGRGRSFGSTMPLWLDELVGGWQISGIPTWRSGLAFSSHSSAFVMGYANDAPAIFNGDQGAVRAKAHKTANGQVQMFADPDRASAAFTGPIGFTIGSRNNMRGPTVLTFDAGLAKTFSITPERVKLQFRGDFFNVLNHPVFNLPGSGSASTANFSYYTSTFGVMTSTITAVGPRVGQFSLRLSF
jgi:hypothetical protein